MTYVSRKAYASFNNLDITWCFYISTKIQFKENSQLSVTLP